MGHSAKALNLPLWKLLGGARERVTTYASGALQRTLSNEEAAVSARRLVERGFRQIKMQLGLSGDTTPAQEFERARIVRESVGPDIKLMADANQGWRVRAGDRNRPAARRTGLLLAGGPHGPR